MRILSMIRKELQEFFRQRELIPLLLVMPFIQLFLIGHVMTIDIKRLPVAVVNLSRSQSAERMVLRIRSTPLFRVRSFERHPIDAYTLLKKGWVKAVIVFRDDPYVKNRPLKYPQIQILLDGVDSNSSQIAAGYFNGIVQNYIFQDINRITGFIPLEAKPLMRYNARLRSINYMGPGLLVVIFSMFLLFLGSASLVREKQQQTIETLMISPLTPLEIYIGKAIPVFLLALLGVSFSGAFFLFYFDIPFQGNFLYLLLSLLVYTGAVLSYAMFISTFASTQQEAMFFAWFSMLTFLMISGFLTPMENAPKVIQWAARLNPTYYMMRIMRELFVKGNDILFFWKELASLGLLAVVIISISLFTYRRFIYR